MVIIVWARMTPSHLKKFHQAWPFSFLLNGNGDLDLHSLLIFWSHSSLCKAKVAKLFAASNKYGKSHSLGLILFSTFQFKVKKWMHHLRLGHLYPFFEKYICLKDETFFNSFMKFASLEPFVVKLVFISTSVQVNDFQKIL